MKIRQGFVSNSSSSSFVIKTKHLTQEQIDTILNAYYDEWGNPTEWVVNHNESDGTITGSTYMDNFSFFELLQSIGVKMKKVKWSD